MLGALIAIVALLVWFWSRPMILVTHLENGEWLASSYSLLEDDADHPRLKLLREREHLEQVIAPGHTQFEKMVLLCHWAHQQWSYKGAPFMYPAWDACEILDLARNVGNKGFCAIYAIVYLQACQSLGLHARYVELPDHFVVGVWSDEYNRWIVMDPLNDVHYELNGTPTTGRELCDAYWKKSLDGLFRVYPDGRRERVTLDDIKVYRMYSIVTAANQLTHPIEIQVNGGKPYSLVRESDPRRYPVIGRDRLGFSSLYLAWKQDGAAEQFHDMQQSDDRDNFTYRMNQNMIFVARRDPSHGLAKLILWPENEPYFKEFEVSVDGTEWHSVPSKELFWPLKPGGNDVEVRSVTRFGWRTRTSHCHIYYKPAWWGLRKPPSAGPLPAAA